MAPRDWTHRYDSTQDPDSDNFFRRRDTAQTGQETRQTAENQVTDEVNRGNVIDWLVDKFNHGQRVQDTYTQDMNTRAQALAQGLDTRDGPIMQCYNYLSTPHPELKTMVTENVDPDAIGSTGDQWISAGNAMVRFQEGVASAINNSEADWQGKAGNSARTFMAQVGNWVGEAGQSAQLAGTQTNLQAVGLADARRNMPDPVDFDADAANRDLQTTTNPLLYVAKLGNYQLQYNRAQSAHEEAAGVVSTYDNTLAGASTMPAFGAPPQMTAGSSTSETEIQQTKIPNSSVDVYRNSNVSTTTTTDGTTDLPPGRTDIPPTQSGDPGGPGNPSNPGVPGNPGVPAIPGPGGGSGSGGSGSGGTGSGSGSGSGSGTGPGGLGTTPSGDIPVLPGPGQFPTPGPTGSNPGQNPNFPGTPPLPIGGLPGPTGGDLARGAGRGFGPGGGPGSTGGYGSGGGPGGMGRPPGMGGMGPGGLGVGGALAAEGAAVRGGAAGARGAAGGGMVPPGKRGEGEEDGEHQRASYLVEGDPDAVFGTDEMTAPPVIGE